MILRLPRTSSLPLLLLLLPPPPPPPAGPPSLGPNRRGRSECGVALAFVPTPNAPTAPTARTRWWSSSSSSSSFSSRTGTRSADAAARILVGMALSEEEFLNPYLHHVAERRNAAERRRAAERRHGDRASERLDEEFNSASDTIPSLSSLPLVPYLGDDGLIPVPEPEGRRRRRRPKSSVFAVYDSDASLRYVGSSRDLGGTLRSLLGRMPEETAYYKAHHVERRGRTYPDLVVDWWLAEAAAESGALPPGNADEGGRALWEGAADAAAAAGADGGEAGEGGPREAADRLEGERAAVLRRRGAREEISFDPELKEMGLLDVRAAGGDGPAPPGAYRAAEKGGLKP